MNILEQIMKEYDAASKDAHFDEGHPIFQMAAHIDELQAKIKELKIPTFSSIKSNLDQLTKIINENIESFNIHFYPPMDFKKACCVGFCCVDDAVDIECECTASTLEVSTHRIDRWLSTIHHKEER